MDRRFEVRKAEMLTDCEVKPVMFRGILERLERFAEPFVACLRRPEQQRHAHSYLCGLLSDLERKNAEAIAYRHDEERQGLQTFIGTAPWEHEPLLRELALQVGRTLGEPDGVLALDPSAFPKKGSHSVGVKRQWCGRLGKVENCQVGMFLAYVSRREQALVNMRLCLPKQWANDRKRRKECGVPREVCYQTRHQLALEMLDEHGPLLPHAWVTGDDEMGLPAWFRRELRDRRERYLLAVPGNVSIRDLEQEPPPYHPGHGRPPKVRFQQVARWCQSLPPEAWWEVEVRDAEKGPLIIAMVTRRVVTMFEEKVGDEELLVIVRWSDEDGRLRHDYHLSNAPADTPPEEFARVARAAHRIEQCFERGKTDAGLADYQVRTWRGWHHHVTLSLLAAWFLVGESQRGKKMDARDHCSPGPQTLEPDPAECLRMRHASADPPRMHTLVATERTRKVLPSQSS
jgi:SRSO17 transposase